MKFNSFNLQNLLLSNFILFEKFYYSSIYIKKFNIYKIKGIEFKK